MFKTRPEGNEIGTVMTNFDHTIDQEIADQLFTNGGFAGYAGWNFRGKVWWAADLDRWACEVWQYHVHIDTICEPTLSELMDTVSTKYGGE